MMKVIPNVVIVNGGSPGPRVELEHSGQPLDHCLTPKQARRMARKLLHAADLAESIYMKSKKGQP